MVAFLFWNVAQRPQLDVLAAACLSEGTDLLILAECGTDTGAVLNAINGPQERRFFEEVFSPNRAVRFFSRLPRGTVSPLFDGPRFSIREVRLPVGPKLIVAGAHLPSRLHVSPDEQYFMARELQKRVAECESRLGHSNTLIIGDLNMNPFDMGMIAADGLHGMMSKRIVDRVFRQFRGQRWNFFYNPMWSRLGDESVGPPGTYYYRSSSIDALFWHTFDQVLLRPSLLRHYQPDSVRVISRVGASDLIRGQEIDRSIGDHLPIALNLKTTGTV